MTAPLADRARVLWGCLSIMRGFYDAESRDIADARAVLDEFRADPHPRIRQIAAAALGQRASTGDAA